MVHVQVPYHYELHKDVSEGMRFNSGLRRQMQVVEVAITFLQAQAKDTI